MRNRPDLNAAENHSRRLACYFASLFVSEGWHEEYEELQRSPRPALRRLALRAHARATVVMDRAQAEAEAGL